ncbi:hypothetical protein PZA11_007555 [Diplocarpon coronariae]|uniref:Uncharacterized protein n=1 Tax=Diplocarpon coronariae TaxID=2795749 RepID=A0A218YYQ3_9HELO|nr:hypothetical protein B2J93_5398 [Marssonina coronariae]
MDKILQHLKDVQVNFETIYASSSQGMESLSPTDMITLFRLGNYASSDMRNAIRDYSGVKPTEAEAQEALSLLRRIAELNVQQMKVSRDDKPVFERMHAANLVRKGVADQDAAREFWKVMAEKMPGEGLKGEVQSLDKQVQSAVAETLRLYHCEV